MSTTIKAVPTTLVFENIYSADAVAIKDLGLSNLNAPLADDDVFNTGCAALNDPHADEDAANAGKTLIKDKEAWKAQHIAAIRLYRSNSYVYLSPGDSFVLATQTGAETVYYLSQVDELLKVTDATSI